MRILAAEELQKILGHQCAISDARRAQSISDIFSSRQLFTAYEIIPPRCVASIAHSHSKVEEIIYIAKGIPTVHYGDQNILLNEGSFVFFGPADHLLHQIVNESDSEVVLVNISINRDGDVVLTEKSRLWAPPVIETKGLLLRALDLADAKSIFEYAKNPNVCRYTLWSAHKSIDDSVSFIRDYALPHYAQGTPEPFGIALREEPNIIIGTVGCFWTSKTAKAMELAYAIGEAHWGKGLVAEAAQNVMEYCFKEFSLKRIQSRCKAENVASARVMEKIGMVYEGTLKSAVFNQNRFWDMRYYAKVVD